MSQLDIVDLISTLLDNEKYKEALNVSNEERLAESFKDNCWDLIPVILGKIQDDTIIIKPSLYGACEQLLTIIIEKSAPEEALLEFIEQIELAKNDAQFGLILPPLQELLKRLSIKRGRSLEWCLNSISTYIENIPIPDHHLEGKERLLMDSDPNTRRITRVYSLLPPFYKYFVNELNEADSNVKTKQIITAFLISLLGKPLIYIDMDPESNANSEARLSCSTIFQDICVIEKNVLKFLVYLEVCHRESKKKTIKDESDNEKSPYEHREKINMTTLSGLFYTVLSGHFEVPESAIPQVYSLDYVLHTAMLSVIHLLNFAEYSPLAKAIALCEAILSRFPNQLTQELLSSSLHFDMCKGLANVAIYSSYESLRKRSVALIGCHVNKFDYKGRCALVKYLIEVSNHSGMIGYAITLYKSSINEAFNNPSMDDCFTGPQFSNMLKKICFLPHGAESDLVELADQIITSLNFLRYLTIKDKVNITGICDCFSYIENNYLEQLRVGLNMSKAHYEVKLKDIEEGKHLPDEKINISLNIGGNVLDNNIPKENMKEIICSALNAFHLIEALKNGRRTIRPFACIFVNNSHGISSQVQTTFEKDPKLSIPSTYTNTNQYEQEDHQYEENIKNSILENALQFVPKSGWSVESLSSGAKAAGYPTITHGLFPNGGGDLVHYFNVKCNEQLVDAMKTWPKTNSQEKVPAQFVENAIFQRLIMIDPYKTTWPKAMAIQAMPNNVPNCLATLLSLVDDICYHSGDRSVDFNWYVRRVGVAGIYKAAELFYLTDSSQDSTATKNFIASRIRDAQLVQSALNLSPVGAAAPQTLTAAFTTAKNMLGINTLK